MDAKESQIYIAVIIAVVILGFVIICFFISIFRQYKLLREMERKNAYAQVEVLEKDRARISTDLHDDLAPMLGAVSLKIKAMRLTQLTIEKDRAILSKTSDNIDEITKRMRAISFALMPGMLYEKGLETVIQAFAKYVSSGSDLEIRFIPSGCDIHLGEQGIIHVYRIVQEIIHNTIKHAKASRLTIALEKEKTYLVLAACDNGIGFDHKHQIKNSKGLGLKSIMNRIYLLKAEFLMDSKPGKGTSITIRIPQQHD